jgi:Saxitoxin biosynthesis operon protein SxtJ
VSGMFDRVSATKCESNSTRVGNMNIIEDIKSEIRATYREPSSADLNILAALFLVLPGLIGAYKVWWKGAQSGYIWIAVGVGLALCRLVPPLFRLIHRLWLDFSVILGYFVSRILLTIIFFLVIIPTGLIMRLVGKDPMDRKLDPAAATYWQRREPEPDQSIERYERQF